MPVTECPLCGSGIDVAVARKVIRRLRYDVLSLAFAFASGFFIAWTVWA
jgi:hypothetical protein